MPAARRHAATIAKEQSMRNHLLATATILAAMSAPIAAQAQNTVGVAGSGSNTIIVDNGTVGIAADQRPAFRQYIVQERVPNYTIPDRVVVGNTLPETGVTFYDVPQSFGATPYRYTVVNGETVLVEPRSRRIVQVID
jgi:non-ribosomal peptide synthetase component E (peptide arylation enzyme)